MKYFERIRALREDNDISQQSVADMLNISQRTYSDYETGRTRIPIDRLLVLGEYYNVSIDYISGASDTKRPFPKR